MFNELGEKLKDFLELERDLVAIKWSVKEPRNIKKEERKSKFCTKLQNAMDGEKFYSTVEEEECMGGMKYSGMKDSKEFPQNLRSGSFLVPGGAFKSIPAVQRAMKDHPTIEPGIFNAILFAPLKDADFDPDVVFVVCNAKQGMTILHANAYDSGSQGIGSGTGPICCTMAAMPYLTGEVIYGFGEAGARNFMNVGEEEVMISIPASDLERIVKNLEEMMNKPFFKRG